MQRDLLYVRHFPKGEKYVSLLRDAQDPTAQQHLQQQRARLRALVAQQLAEQAAVTEADEGAALASGLAAAAAAAVGVGTAQPATPAAAKAAAPPASGAPGAAMERGKQQKKQGKRGRDEEGGGAEQQGADRAQPRPRGTAQAPAPAPPALVEQEVMPRAAGWGWLSSSTHAPPCKPQQQAWTCAHQHLVASCVPSVGATVRVHVHKGTGPGQAGSARGRMGGQGLGAAYQQVMLKVSSRSCVGCQRASYDPTELVYCLLA